MGPVGRVGGRSFSTCVGFCFAMCYSGGMIAHAGNQFLQLNI